MGKPQKLYRKQKLYRDSCCIICGYFADRECSCGAVSYCSNLCRKLHSKAGHKPLCKNTSLASVKSLTSVFPALLEKSNPPLPLPPGHVWSYQDFMNVGYHKPIDNVSLMYRPCGLLNSGCTCFLNVTLQCLVLTRPLFSYLTSPLHSHRSRCSSPRWCFLCELESHIGRSFLNSFPFLPDNILLGLTLIGGDFTLGRQEDAHEFMRFAIEAMHSACLLESNPPASPDSTIVRHTFAGRLRSEVTCTACLNTSSTYETMMDLTVEIGGRDGEDDSLHHCLDRFTSHEWLEGDNMYKCSACDRYVRAKKRISIDYAPNVLTIALKRFECNGLGKLNNRVTFPLKLDLATYITHTHSEDEWYKLYAVVVHQELSNDLAHYICFAKDFRGNWFEIDDKRVSPVTQNEVLSQPAYMLMYSRVRPNPHPLIDPQNQPHPQAPPEDPQPKPKPEPEPEDDPKDT